MDSQIWLNVLVNDHQFGYITELKKEKEKPWLVSCFLGAVFPFLSFKLFLIFIFIFRVSFFLLGLYRCPIPPLQQLPLRFHFTFFAEWRKGGKLRKSQLKPGIRWVVDFVLPTALGLYYSSDISTTLARLYVLLPLQVQMGGVLDPDLIWSIILLLLLIWLLLCCRFERFYDQGFLFCFVFFFSIFQYKTFDEISPPQKKKLYIMIESTLWRRRRRRRREIAGRRLELVRFFPSCKFKVDPNRT